MIENFGVLPQSPWSDPGVEPVQRLAHVIINRSAPERPVGLLIGLWPLAEHACRRCLFNLTNYPRQARPSDRCGCLGCPLSAADDYSGRCWSFPVERPTPRGFPPLPASSATYLHNTCPRTSEPVSSFLERRRTFANTPLPRGDPEPAPRSSSSGGWPLSLQLRFLPFKAWTTPASSVPRRCPVIVPSATRREEGVTPPNVPLPHRSPFAGNFCRARRRRRPRRCRRRRRRHIQAPHSAFLLYWFRFFVDFFLPSKGALELRYAGSSRWPSIFRWSFGLFWKAFIFVAYKALKSFIKESRTFWISSRTWSSNAQPH